ncbi:MAG TPA: nitroreductase family protein [Prolixibacteraceae bacterium]|nr:nitroreductase family protein [Prolixibacteraceae bacterium]
MPEINLEKCIRCLKCVNDCPSKAITIQTGEIAATCIHCGHCVAICPEKAVRPDFGEILSLSQHPVTAEGFRNFSAGIRSCRSFQRKEIPEQLLAELVENMKQYPSASNSRTIQITLVRGEKEVSRLNDQTVRVLKKVFGLVGSPFVRVFLNLFAPSLDGEKMKNYRQKFNELASSSDSMVCYHAPAVILFHAKASRTEMNEADAYIWATYTSLYANAMGLGTCFNGFIVNAMSFNKKMGAAFHLPSGHQLYAALLVGYPNVTYSNEVSRKKPEAQSVS